MTKTKSNPIWLTLLNRIAAADQRYRQAQKLKSLPGYRLEDMGMTREDADQAFLRDRYSRPADRDAMPIARKA